MELHKKEERKIPISRTVFSSNDSGGFKKLTKSFYRRNCITVAKELLGKILVVNNGRLKLSGIITETEAYPGKNDEASHSYIGKTKRNEKMFEAGGIAYVYFTYGNHFCFNVVTGKEGLGSAVLIRSLQPLTGTDIMKKNRGTTDIYNLTTGPGKITQAFGINRKHNGMDLTGDIIYIINNNKKEDFNIVRSKRIGIKKNRDKLFRFTIEGNPFISVKQKK